MNGSELFPSAPMIETRSSERFFVTVTVQLAVMLRSAVLVTVMVTLPSATPLTRPFASTVAIVLSELVQTTSRCVVSAGVKTGSS